MHKKKCCFLTYDGIFYCFNAAKKKVFIYTVKHLDLVDVCLFLKVILILWLDPWHFQFWDNKDYCQSSNCYCRCIMRELLDLLCSCLPWGYELKVIVELLSFARITIIRWQKKLTHRFTTSIKDISFSAGGEYILTAGSKHLAIYQLKFNYTDSVRWLCFYILRFHQA